MGRKSLVNYHNDLNKMALKNWNSDEMNILFTVLSEIKDKGTDTIKLEKEMFEPLIEKNGRNVGRFIDTLTELQNKVFQLVFFERKNVISRRGNMAIEQRAMPLFADFRMIVEDNEKNFIDSDTEIYGEVSVSKHYEYILNKLNGNFTQWELSEFYTITSKYSKTIYRLLKQYRSTGFREFVMDEFKALVDTPSSYSQSDIDKRILDTAKRDLKAFFPNLKITKLKKKKGNKVTHIRFTFTPDKLARKGMQGHLERVKRRYRDVNTSLTPEEILSKHIEFVEKKNPDNFDAYLTCSIDQDLPKIAQKSLFELSEPQKNEDLEDMFLKKV